LYINNYLGTFKATHNTQKNTLIILTDGLPTNTHFMSDRNNILWPNKENKIFVNSKKNNVQYIVPLSHGNRNALLHDLQQTLTDLIAGDHPDTKIVGIFVVSTKSFSTIFGYYTHTLGTAELADAKKQAKYAMKKEGFHEYAVRGYDKFFIIPIDVSDEDEVFDKVTPNMSAAQIARAAAGSLLAQKMARVMANKLIAEVA
jgi:F0F1-type ATP synthase gamma subunit